MSMAILGRDSPRVTASNATWVKWSNQSFFFLFHHSFQSKNFLSLYWSSVFWCLSFMINLNCVSSLMVGGDVINMRFVQLFIFYWMDPIHCSIARLSSMEWKSEPTTGNRNSPSAQHWEKVFKRFLICWPMVIVEAGIRTRGLQASKWTCRSPII